MLEDMNTALTEMKKQFPGVKVNGELEMFKVYTFPKQSIYI